MRNPSSQDGRSTAAGDRDTLITFERSTPVQNSVGEETLSWSALGNGEWAKVFWGRGEERREAAAEQRVQSATFKVIANPFTLSITVGDRIVCGGKWDIGGISASWQPGHIEFAAARCS